MAEQPIDHGGGASDGAPTFFKAIEEQTEDLEQGDIIPRRAPVIDEVLRKYHPYHIDNPSNEMFAVLTQSCDLARHERRFKARYIALAPLRPLRIILQREFGEYLLTTPGGLYVLGSSDTESRYSDFLTKLINNNDSRYFFIPQRPERQISEDMCIMLPLAMSIRAEHYEACLAGRVAQITDLFQAKLGWLLGQQFSRVGTPDWSADGVANKVRNVSERALTWFPEHQFVQIKTKLRKFERDHPGRELDEGAFNEMCSGMEGKRDFMISRVFGILIEQGILPAPPNKTLPKLRKILQQDPDIAAVLPKN